MSAMTMMGRRELLKTLAAGFTVLQLPAAQPGAPLFFTAEQFALLDHLTELMIPADDHSPGAHEAGVAQFIDKMAAEAITADEKNSWRIGLTAIDELAKTKVKKPFLKASKEQQIALLNDVCKGAGEDAKQPAERFFGQLKDTTAFVYYSSSIGIHKEINYKGNVLLQEFVGYDVSA